MEQVELKMNVLRILSFVIIFVFVFSLCGCSTSYNTVEYKIPSELPLFEDELVLENDTMQLLWNSEYQFGYAKNKKSNEITSPVPMDYISSGEYNANIFSPLLVEYYNITDTFVQTDVGYYCVEDGNFKSEKLKNRIKATYYFAEPEITVSLCYELKDDYLYMYVDSDDLYETGKTKILSISIAPYFSSSQNTESQDNYLFVPTGSGALMYTNDDVKGTSREYIADVYGTNFSRLPLDNNGNEEAVRMPVYGAKSNGIVSTGIISSGDTSASIRALAGDVSNGYSCVYPIFTVRDYVNIEWDTGKEKNGKKFFTDVALINEKIPKNKEYGINLYTNYKEDAGYIDIAKTYKEYLSKNNLLCKSNKINADYNLELLGGVSLKAYTLGFPHQKLKVMTDFDDAKNILNDLSDTKLEPNLILNGFGKEGLTASEIGDSFAFSSKFGKIDDLMSYATKNNIGLQFNMNLLTYSKSGNGFNYTFDSAIGANGESISLYSQKVNVRVEDKEKKPLHILGIANIGKATEKSINFLRNKKLGFYSENLGSIVFSDCTNIDGMLGGSVNITNKAIASLKKDVKSLVLGKANSYCAGLVDAVTETPVSNGSYQCFDEYVPFYQYVFGEYTKLYGPSLNICNDKTRVLLKCIESGVYPSFTIANKVDVSLIDSAENYLYACDYTGNKQFIEDILNSTKDFYSSIDDSYITYHEILQTGITKTVFSNGIEVVVNHTDLSFNYENEVIDAYSYKTGIKGG